MPPINGQHDTVRRRRSVLRAAHNASSRCVSPQILSTILKGISIKRRSDRFCRSVQLVEKVSFYAKGVFTLSPPAQSSGGAQRRTRFSPSPPLWGKGEKSGRAEAAPSRRAGAASGGEAPEPPYPLKIRNLDFIYRLDGATVLPLRFRRS